MEASEMLAAAISARDADAAARVLEQHPELKQRLNEGTPESSFGMQPLLAAVQWSDRRMVDVLLAAGADINERSEWWAGGFGVLDECSAEMAPFLIERGAVVDAHAAARLGMLKKLQELVAENPAVVHARGGDGQTPLHFASTLEIARFLLEHRADIDALDIDHESTPAQYMLRVMQARHFARDRQDIARYLVAQGCKTDILMAAALGNLPLVRQHLEADPASIRTRVSEEYFPKQNPRSGGTIYIWIFGWHRTAHLVARDFGHEDVFQFLMEHSPEELKLSQACELGDEKTFRALLSSRPNLVETLTDDDRRRLPNAAQNNNTNAVRMMLQAGWPTDVRGQHGMTPLHWAAWHGNAEMVREILQFHPKLESKDNDFGVTEVQAALHGSQNGWHRNTGDYGATVELLLNAGAEAPEVTDDLEGSEAAREALRRYAAGARS